MDGIVGLISPLQGWEGFILGWSTINISLLWSWRVAPTKLERDITDFAGFRLQGGAPSLRNRPAWGSRGLEGSILVQSGGSGLAGTPILVQSGGSGLAGSSILFQSGRSGLAGVSILFQSGGSGLAGTPILFQFRGPAGAGALPWLRREVPWKSANRQKASGK
jgi:hypothetical protein